MDLETALAQSEIHCAKYEKNGTAVYVDHFDGDYSWSSGNASTPLAWRGNGGSIEDLDLPVSTDIGWQPDNDAESYGCQWR